MLLMYFFISGIFFLWIRCFSVLYNCLLGIRFSMVNMFLRWWVVWVNVVKLLVVVLVYSFLILFGIVFIKSV